jgi:antimicrobial peptide system SdpB family protein
MNQNQIFTNVYGLARSLLALGLLLTLLFNDIQLLLPYENYQHQIKDLFLMFDYKYIRYLKIMLCVCLLWTISGYTPYITGIIHFWISYSFFHAINAVEGGDQISVGLSALLVPITLADNRVNHWGGRLIRTRNSYYVDYFCYSCFIMIKFQMCLLYFDSGVEKLKVSEWAGGTALYYWFTHHSFGAPEWLSHSIGYCFKNGWFVASLTWGVIALEVLLFAAIFMNQKQKLVLFVFALIFHFMIAIVHGLPTFGLAMSSGLILYLVPFDKNINFTRIKYVSWNLLSRIRHSLFIGQLRRMEI